MSMKDIYVKYFQKSATFLYPLLNMKKNKHPKPRQTYVTWDSSITTQDRILICLFDRDNTEAWKKFELNVLMTHPLMMDSVIVDDDQIIYLFDFNVPNLKDDFDTFIEGKYSKFTNDSKKVITDYYGIQSAEWVFIESYIHPKKYFEIYSQLLKVDLSIIKETGELCDKYNSDKENCAVMITEPINKN